MRNRLKYALTGKETKIICIERNVLVDGKVRTDPNYPAGFMDVVEIPKSNDQFRLIYDTKGRYVLHRISDEEKKYKLAKVKKQELTKKSIPYIVTHDGRTIRYPDPSGDSSTPVTLSPKLALQASNSYNPKRLSVFGCR